MTKKQNLKSEIERPDIDEAQKNLLQQGLAFWQSVERYTTRGDIVKGTQGSKETQGNIGQGER